MNRLKSYVRRTILQSAREYAPSATRRTQESTKSAFIDAMRGTDTGWCNDLIYTSDALDMFNREWASYEGDSLEEAIACLVNA
jgi:hypothetical protein